MCYTRIKPIGPIALIFLDDLPFQMENQTRGRVRPELRVGDASFLITWQVPRRPFPTPCLRVPRAR